MPKKSRKSLSKRVKLKDKFKIARKVKEHHKKQRKEAKKNEKKKPSVLKDPGIPANYPYREQVIKELQFEHQRIVAQRAEKRKAASERREAKMQQDDEDMEAEELDPLQQLAAIREAAEGRQTQFEENQGGPDAASTGAKLGKGTYYEGFKKVVDSSDVILQVLDARDPYSCRCLEVERYVRKVDPNKRIILVLNKIDLVPPEVVKKWLVYLREELPAVAFKAATKKKGTIKQIRMPQHSGAGAGNSADLETSECLGADTLMQLLKNYSRSNDVKSVIAVGVVGLPNVGKSSVINSLKRSNVAHTGNAPGITKSVQEIHLDKHIRLIDSPGLVTTTAENPAAEALYGGVKIEQTKEPVAAVASVLERVESRLLMSVYKIAAYSDCEGMLRQVAVARGRLRKGGTADVEAAARVVLSDWRDGTIPFHTLPPSRGNEQHETVSIVNLAGKGFDMSSVIEFEEQRVFAKLHKSEMAE